MPVSTQEPPPTTGGIPKHTHTAALSPTPEAVLRADIVEEAYGGPVEIVQTGNGRVPIVLPVSRLRDRVKEQ